MAKSAGLAQMVRILVVSVIHFQFLFYYTFQLYYMIYIFIYLNVLKSDEPATQLAPMLKGKDCALHFFHLALIRHACAHLHFYNRHPP